jgi:hypothetical protein
MPGDACVQTRLFGHTRRRLAQLPFGFDGHGDQSIALAIFVTGSVLKNPSMGVACPFFLASALERRGDVTDRPHRHSRGLVHTIGYQYEVRVGSRVDSELIFGGTAGT